MTRFCAVFTVGLRTIVQQQTDGRTLAITARIHFANGTIFAFNRELSPRGVRARVGVGLKICLSS